MRSRTILALAAAGMLAAACASTAATQAPATAPPAAPSVTLAPTAPPDTPPPVPDPATTPMETTVPQTDGEGDEYVVGNLASPDVVKDYTVEKIGDVTQYRGGQLKAAQMMNDPRVTGLVAYNLDLDLFTKAARQWMTYTLANDGGSWTGPCTGGAWTDAMSGGPGNFAWGCWLTGSGDYEGYTFYQTVVREASGTPVIHGVIFQGAPPKV